MKLRPTAFVALVTSALVVISSHVITQSRTARRLDTINGLQAVDGEVLVQLRTGAPAERASIEAAVDADEDQPIGAGVWRRIHSRSHAVQTILTALRGRAEIVAVEPNYIVQTTDTLPNDPTIPWGLLNTTTPGADIHATKAWDITTGSAANVIGVIDTGLDYTHPDLAANVWSAPTQFTIKVAGVNITCPAGSHGFNAIQFAANNLAAACDPMDDNGHGTHTSGTIGAVGNNALGVVGVNWTTRIMGLKFLNSGGSGAVSDAVNAVDFALQTKAFFAGSSTPVNVRAFSNSWGGSGYSLALSQAIDRANSADALFVAAAGNSGLNIDTTPFYPASYTQANVVAVAATTETDTLAGFSNYGPKTVALGAPGNNVYSTWPGATYAVLSGTSMATPHVSGAAMLLLSACSLTTTQVKAALLNNVDPLASLNGLVLTNGRLNVNAALQSCATPPSVTMTSPLDGATFAAVPATITLAANATDSDGIAKVEFYQGNQLIGTSSSSPYGGTWSNVVGGKYTLTAKAYDVHGAAASSAPVHITVGTSGGSATFVGSDANTEGSWQGVYGADGYNVITNAVNYPSYAAITPSGQGTWTWAASTTDVRALQKVGASDRVAATWYGTTFSIDVNLTDGASHTMSLYAVDWDSTSRAETIQILDSITNAVLDSRSVSGFHNGQYLRWTVKGHVVVQVIANAGVNAVISGLFFDTSSGNTPPTVALTAPADGATYTAPANVVVTANAADSNGISRVEFYETPTGGSPALIGSPVTTSPYQITWTNAAVGTYTLTAKAYDTLGASQTSAPVHLTVAPAGSAASATFVGTDSTTQGTWRGVYGVDGYNVIGDTVNYPAYATVTSGAPSWTWASSTTDVRALQKAGASDRIASTWYGPGVPFSIDVNLTDGALHTLGLYVLDWDTTARIETIEIHDAASNALLDSRSISGFHNGQYWRWTLGGHVVVRFTVSAGANAVVSGLFFDSVGGPSPPPPPPPANAATFVGTDSTTQGTWRGVYGADGYNVIGDTVSYPAYATVTPSGQASWTWVASTTDVRALQKAGASDRIASTWYGPGVPFSIDVNLTDGASHTLGLYVVDWDSTVRSETIEIRDAASNALLESRSITGFHNGQYWRWAISGHVVVNVIVTSGVNAVVSGLFFQ